MWHYFQNILKNKENVLKIMLCTLKKNCIFLIKYRINIGYTYYLKSFDTMLVTKHRSLYSKSLE